MWLLIPLLNTISVLLGMWYVMLQHEALLLAHTPVVMRATLPLLQQLQRCGPLLPVSDFHTSADGSSPSSDSFGLPSAYCQVPFVASRLLYHFTHFIEGQQLQGAAAARSSSSSASARPVTLQ
jgi:hypothetical protein